MARPNKQGLDYFPFDVDFFEDEKIEAISGEFGIKGEIVTIKLLCAVYRNGYFILWSDMLKMKLLKNLPGISSELLDAILNRLVLWDFFDKNLFDSMGVLTSKGIQKRFFEATKRRQKNENLPYLLVSVSDNEVNVNNNSSRGGILSTKTTQRKEKESKVNNTTQELGIDPKFGDPLFSIEKLREEISYQSIWIEQVGMLNHLTPETIDYWINEFFNVLIKRGSEPKSVKDFKNHFPDWLNIQLDKEKKRVKSPPGKISKARQMIINAQKLMKPDE